MNEVVLKNIHKKVRERRPVTGTKGCMIHMDNAPCHNSDSVSNEIKKYGLARMPHPPYSQDIAPYDFWLFGFLKE